MATWIYKKGESKLVDYEAMKRHLLAGWSTSKETVKKIEAAEIEASEIADDDGLEAMTRAKLFELADERGIETKARMSKADLLELLQ